TMTDNCTMAEMLRAPTEGYAEAIVVHPILAEQFELKHSLINMMTSEQFFGLEKDNPHDHIRCYEIAKLTHAVNEQTSAMTTAMTAMLRQFQATPPSDLVKAVKETCVTCGGAHLYYQCIAADGNTFLELWDNIQEYVSVAAVQYNQGNPGYRPPGMANQTRPPGSGSLPSSTVANPKGELKSITTCSGLVTDGPTVSAPPKSFIPEVDKRVEETFTDPDLAEYTIKVPPPLEKLQELANTPLNENCSAVFLKKLPEKLGDPGKFLIQCGFNELKCKALADLDIDAFNDIHPYFNDDPLSGSTTYSANSLLKEFTNELALIIHPHDYDDNLEFDINQTDLANLDDYFVDPIPEMFTEEHAPDYSSPPKFDVYLDDFLENESYADIFYDDPFDSEGEKIKESKLLMDELDLPCDSLPYSESDSFNSQDFSRVDDLPSTDNEDKVFNPGILIHEKSVTIITRVAQEKKLAISYASLVFKDFEPLFYAPLFFKDVPKSRMLLPFSSENKDKVFKPGIHTSGKDCPDCEVFHALGIVLYLQELHILSFILGI
nr:reverse transcriptase domain-containing protein [Tanacetum cinerariifolium]